MPRQNVAESVGRDVREARSAREDHFVHVQAIAASKAELHLTIMQTQIRLAEVMATLRRLSRCLER